MKESPAEEEAKCSEWRRVLSLIYWGDKSIIFDHPSAIGNQALARLVHYVLPTSRVCYLVEIFSWQSSRSRGFTLPLLQLPLPTCLHIGHPLFHFHRFTFTHSFLHNYYFLELLFTLESDIFIHVYSVSKYLW